VVNVASRAVVATCDLGGQPDSVAKSADGKFLAVVIENERDEEVNDGAIPQLPGGNLTILPLADGAPDCAAKVVVDLAGLAAVAPEDPEPELVDINAANQAVVTLQENNHIAIVDLATGKVTASFTAGTVDLAGIDTEKDGVIALTGSKAGVAREPDAVQWIGDDRFVTANEGDYQGGSRGFTIFRTDGTVDYESGPGLRAHGRPPRPLSGRPQQEGQRARGRRGRDLRRGPPDLHRLGTRVAGRRLQG
jgi:DNA-binding beta-propeller fold protein YncE